MAGSITADEARKELARRELARRRSVAPEEPAGADAPWYQDAATAAGDVLRLGSNAVTLGFRDKLAPMLTGRSVEEERAMTQEARERAGTAGLATELGGAMVLPGGAAKAGLSLAAAPAVRAMPGIKGLLARSGLMGVEGEALSSATAAGTDQEYQPGIGMAAGVGGNIAGEGIAAGVGKIAGLLAKKPAIPTAPDLLATGRAAYDKADAAGVIFNPQGVQKIRSGVIKDLTDRGFDPVNEPGVMPVLKRLEEMSAGNVTLKGLDTLRKVARNGYVPGNQSNNDALEGIIDQIDDFVDAADPSTFIAGNAAEGASALKEARKAWHMARKSETIDDAIERAQRRAASTGSGGNANNQIRQNFRAILDSPKKRRGFTKDEIQAMEEVVRGTPSQNALRLIGKLSPQGSGLMLALGIGGTAINPMMAGVSGAGAVAKALADRGTSRGADLVSEIVRAGGSRAATAAPQNATQLLAQQKRDAIARALMAIGVQQGVGAGR